MAASLSRRLCRAFFLAPNPRCLSHHLSKPFCTHDLSSNEQLSEPESEPDPDSGPVPPSATAQPPPPPSDGQRTVFDRPLENGLDVGIYKAILVGQVGQSPLQKQLKGGRTVTLLSLGTGGIRNNRRPLENEEPKDYANRCAVQWHRVSVYPERLGNVVMKHVTPGSILYLEGNLETKIFTDPITGLVRRVREIAVRRNGRLVFLGNGEAQKAAEGELKGIGYY